jgi:hypothetical protein
MGPGEYLAEREINQWSYTIALSSAADPRTAAHASWIKGDVGILMLREILPEFGPLRRNLGVDKFGFLLPVCQSRVFGH